MTRPLAGLRTVLTIVITLLGVASVAARLPLTGVPIELLRNAGFQVGVAALLIGLLCIPRSTTRLSGLAALIIAAAQLGPVAALHIIPGPTSAVGPKLRVASFNTFFGNPDPRPMIDWLDRERFDVCALLEVSPAWKPALEHVRRLLPHQHVIDVTPRLLGHKTFSIALLSRHPIVAAQTRGGDDGAIPWLDATIAIDGAEVGILVVHALGPRRSEELAARDALFEAIASTVLESPRPANIVIGDFNATLYSPALTRLMERSGLSETRRGFGRCPTWFPFDNSPLRTGFGTLGLDLDRMLVGSAFTVESFGVGPALGSDHRPIVASITLRGSVAKPK